MAYSRWATVDELKSKLTPVSYDSEIKKSGIPMMYDDNNLYIKDDEAHTMVIGSTAVLQNSANTEGSAEPISSKRNGFALLKKSPS